MELSLKLAVQSRIIEQQTPGGRKQPDASLQRINPLVETLWDADDSVKISASGQLDAGDSYILVYHVMADWTAHTVIALAGAKKGSKFCSTLHMDWQDATGWQGHEQPSRYAAIEGRFVRTRDGVQTPEYDHDSPKLLPVVDSNGAVGALVTVSFMVENLGRDIRELGMTLYIGKSPELLGVTAPCATMTSQGTNPRIRSCP